MSTPRIRPAGPADAALLARLHARCFRPGWDEEAVARLLDGRESFALAAWRGPRPAGLVIARAAAEAAEILTMGVVPEGRRAGLGRRLLEAALAEAAARGARRMVLEVAETNAAARRLYDAAGFTVVARRDRYYRAGRARPEGALVMAKALAA